MPRTVAVFDWDGVVIDSSVAHERSWEALAKEENLPLPADHFKRGFGKRNELIIPDILNWTRDPAEVKRLSHRKEALYRDIARTGHVRLLPGVRELCGALKDLGIPCVIGTSTHKENLALSFELFGIGHFFAGAVASEDVTKGKPDPEVFLKACALGGGDQFAQAAEIHRLGQKVECASFQSIDRGVQAAVSGDHRHGYLRVAQQNMLHQLKACTIR